MKMLAVLALLATGDVASLSRAFVQAWDANDPKALAELFAPDADIVTPDGTVVAGRAQIEAFYAQVFAHGLTGVPATTEITRVRELGQGLAIVDARFAIGGKESGIMAAVVEKQRGVWRIRALRENTKASALTPFGP